MRRGVPGVKVLRGAARVLVVLALAILVASYLGGLHPFGDTLAVARLALAAGVGVLALLARALGARRIARVGLIAGLIAALPILWAYAVPARGTDAPAGGGRSMRRTFSTIGP